MALTLIITDVGRAALVNAAHNGTAPVTIASVGLSGAPTAPTSAATSLPSEFKRVATISGDVVAADTIHLVVRDESADAFTLRTFGLYLADGTLFGIYGQVNPVLEKSSQAMMLLSIDVKFEDIAANQVTFGNANFLNPPATTEQIGVVELATLAETLAGLDDRRTPAARMVKDAVYQWLDARFGANNSAIWHPGNDGAGSGLDADLLDGRQGNAYAQLDGNLPFTGTIRAGSTNALLMRPISGNVPTIIHRTDGAQYYMLLSGASGNFDANWNDLRPFQINLANGRIQSGNGQDFFGGTAVRNSLTLDGAGVWTSANDGSGSGLDADLLDGQDSSYYTNVAGRLGFNPVQQGTGIAQTPNTVKIGWSVGGRLRATVDSSDQGNFVFDAHIGDVWRSSNDGAGSGLDADMLDGLQANVFARTDVGSGAAFAGPLSSRTFRLDSGFGGNAFTVGTGDGASYSTFNVALDCWYGLGIRDPNGAVNGFYDARAGLWDVKSGYRVNGNIVWHTANDGAGSGLDADLLDGQDSSFFTDIPARLGYTPLNRGGDTMTGNLVIRKPSPTVILRATDTMSAMLHSAGNRFYILRGEIDAENWTSVGGGWPLSINLTNNDADFGGHVRAVGNYYARNSSLVWDSGNDGAGSGLDADLLDGQDSSFYTDVAGRLGFTPVRQGGGAGQGSNVVMIGWGGSRLRAQVDATDQGAIVFDAHISDVWRVSNDGSGSGLDADLLDGYQADAFQRVVAQNMAEVNGYRVFADGTKECWTRFQIGQHQNVTWALPVAHGEWVNPTFAVSTANGVADVQDNTGISSINGAPPESITFWNADNRTITIWVRTLGR